MDAAGAGIKVSVVELVVARGLPSLQILLLIRVTISLHATGRLTGLYCPCLYTSLFGKGLCWREVMDKSAASTTRVRQRVKAFFKALSALIFSVKRLSSFLSDTHKLSPTKENAPVRVRYFQMMLASSLACARR